MSIKVKPYSMGAVVAMAVVAVLTPGPTVAASTTACGTGCNTPTNQSLGAGGALTISVSAMSSGSACGSVTVAALQASSGCVVTIGVATASSTNAGQDWVVMIDSASGGVANFVAHGALPPALGIQYSNDDVVEIEAVPGGAASGQCLEATQGTVGLGFTSKLALAPCGQFTTTVTAGVTTISDPTAWILDQANDANGFVDLISGTDQSYSLPEVMTVTGSGTRASLSVQPLSEFGGVVSPTQMWSFTYGAPTAAAVRSGAKSHT